MIDWLGDRTPAEILGTPLTPLAAGAGVARIRALAPLPAVVTAFKKRFGINPSRAKVGARCPTLLSSLRTPMWALHRD